MASNRALFRRALLLTAAASCFATPQLAAAQDDEPIDVIVVTATKRAESIQTVPLSITALSGVDLQARGAVDFIDYARAIPNFAFGSTENALASPSREHQMMAQMRRGVRGAEPPLVIRSDRMSLNEQRRIRP